MVDFVTIWSPETLSGDWLLMPPSLESDADLATAVIISLFTDRLANPDDPIPDASGNTPPNRRGWWGDTNEQVDATGAAVAPDLIGSRLWLLSREKRTESVRQRAEIYGKEALRWLTVDGVASAVDVTAAWRAQSGEGFDQLILLPVITRNDGRVVQLQYAWAWQQIGASNAA